MLEVKPISRDSIARATAKAETYRLLNEPEEAESICRDILSVDPENHHALVMLLLAITDQFGRASDVEAGQAHQILGRLATEYERTYYGGIIAERWVKAQLKGGAPPSLVATRFQDAMDLYRRAMALAPAGNDDAILRWNACVRFAARNPALELQAEEYAAESGFHEGAPAH